MVFAIKFGSPEEAAEEEYALRDGWGHEVNTAVSGDTLYVEGGDMAEKIVKDWYPDEKPELVNPPEDIAKMLHGEGKESYGADEKLSYEKGHKNSKGEDAPWVIRSHKDGSVLASFPTKKEAENHMKTMKRYTKAEGRFTEIKAAIRAAWSAANAKWFRLDFKESTERLDVYPIASDNKGVGVSWGVLPERNVIAQYAEDLRNGNSTVEREMPYKDLDDLEKIFTDEFKAMDETLEIGSENGADIHPLEESALSGKARSDSWFTLDSKTREDDLAAKNKTQEGTDGFSHLWELQAQQAKETLEELTKKFSDADRLAFEIHNFPHAKKCDVAVTVDGKPFITAEFEGGRHSGIRWHCFEDDVTDVHLDAGDDDAAKDMILAFKDEILEALTSLYGLSTAADEGGQSQEPQEPADTPKQERDQWCVEFCDIYSNVEKEYYNTEDDAKARYAELAERGDIEWVEDPVLVPATKEEKVSYDDYAESVKTILMGREFEYGPETANEFVVDDYKDLVRKNYDAGKGAVAAAADIDAAYMGKE